MRATSYNKIQEAIMTKKKLFFIIGAIVIALLLTAVIIETSLTNSKENLIGKWNVNETGVIAQYDFKNDNTLDTYINGQKTGSGKWSYSWFKVTVEYDDGTKATYKSNGNSLEGDILSLTKEEAKKFEPVLQNNFFKKGFFGYGEKGNFKYWSFAHLTPIVLYGIAIFLIYHYREKLKNWKHEESFRFIFGAAMMFAEMSYYWRLTYVGGTNPDMPNLLDYLPLQVCEWTCILAIFMITKKSKWIYPICFYVCLTIGIFPLLTPSVLSTTGPAYYRYYQYWLEHILPPLAVFYMTFVHGFRPTKKGIASGLGFMLTLTIFALISNANIEGANYLYIAKGTAVEGGASLMDPIYNLVGGSQILLLSLLFIVVLGLFVAAYYAHIGIIKLHNKLQAKKTK